MSVEVCTVFAPRDDAGMGSLPWRDYLPLLRAQRDSARWFGHKHLVVTDADLGNEFSTMRVPLDKELMRAMIGGVVARLQAGGPAHLVFLDVDCLIAQPLDTIFAEKDFDLGLTNRENEFAPINNGAMYVHAQGIPAALGFFKHAWALCGTHWGADQEAISQAAAPVYGPPQHPLVMRHGCQVRFLNMKKFGAVPKQHLRKHSMETYVVHFKGETKKWMLDYANAFIFQGGRDGAG